MKRLSGRRNSGIASFVAAALASAAVSQLAIAQSADATLTGRASPGSEVTVTNTRTGLTRHTKAGGDGTYTLLGLPPGTYKVQGGGATGAQDVTLSVASTETLDLAGALETVVVSGTRLVETRTSEVGQVVSLQQIETVPQLTRNFLEFADSVPGIVFNKDSKGKTSIRGGAQNDNSVNVYIDGVGQKGYVRSGLSGQTDNTQGNPFPQLAIGEYKVITSNYKAEYDQISSAAITADTKSGTNQFEGEAFGLYTSDHFRAETPGELASNPNIKTPSKDKEFGAALGGPIIENVAHFFVTYEGKRYTTPVTVTANNATPAVIAQLPPGALAQLGPATLPFNEDLVFAKVDWEPTSADRLVLDTKIRHETGLGDQAGPGTAASASIETTNRDDRYSLRWQRSADRWFNEALLTYEDVVFNPQVKGASQNGADYTNPLHNDDVILATNGSDPRAGQNKTQKGWAVADDITFSNLSWITGDHTVKAGVKFKQVKLTAQDAIINNPVFYYNVDLVAGTATVPWQAVFATQVPGLNPVATSQDKQFGIYIQDDWKANRQLTFNLGIRWDIEKNPSYLDFVTPQAIVNAFNTPDPGCSQPAYAAQCSPGQTYGQSLAKGGVNPADYLSNGHNRSAYNSEFQPRLGFSFDLNEDQRHVVFGGIGRAYDRDLYDFLQLEQTKIALGQQTVNFNVPDHPCTVGAAGKNGPCLAWDPNYLNGVQNLQALFASSIGEVDLMNNHLKVPYSDQFSLGMRNRVGDWNTSASVARIISKDGFAFTLGNRRPDGSFWGPVPWGGPAQPWLYPPPGLTGNLIIGGNGIETRTTQLLLSAEKPYTKESHWGATIAYTYTDAKQNRDINEHYSFDEETIRQYPFIQSNAAAKHRLVATGSIGLPWNFIVAGKLTIATPIPHNDIECYNTAGVSFPQGGQCSPVAYTASGLGYRSFDMEVTKNFNLGEAATLYARVDMLNLFNVKNYVDYTVTTSPANGLITGAQYNPTGNISGSTREFRLTVGAKF